MKKRWPHDTSVQKATRPIVTIKMWMQFNVMSMTLLTKYLGG